MPRNNRNRDFASECDQLLAAKDARIKRLESVLTRLTPPRKGEFGGTIESMTARYSDASTESIFIGDIGEAFAALNEGSDDA